MLLDYLTRWLKPAGFFAERKYQRWSLLTNVCVSIEIETENGVIPPAAAWRFTSQLRSRWEQVYSAGPPDGPILRMPTHRLHHFQPKEIDLTLTSAAKLCTVSSVPIYTQQVWREWKGYM
jgi:hypothetical protein